MTAQAVVLVVTLSAEELRLLVREELKAALADRAPAVAAPLVDGRELARLLSVSLATVRRMTAEGLPHVFAGASPRYEPDVVRAWLAERGRRGTTAAPSRTGSIAGVRLLSRPGVSK